MANKEVDAIKDTIRTPGWQVVEEKAEIVLKGADLKLHQATKETFDYSKGYYEGVKVFHHLLTKDHLELANFQGIVKTKQ